MSKAPGRRLVWDLPLRLFHWLLVLAIAGSWATAELSDDLMQWHIYLGYGVLGLLLFRVLWGLVGPRHARFTSFVHGPRRVLAYARTVLEPNTPPSAGHNPMGGLMVVLMLLLVGVQAVSGLFATDEFVYAGPYNGAVSAQTGKDITDLHEFNFDVMISGAIALHLLAIGWYGWRKRQNLTAAMLSGYKPAVAAGDAIENSALLRALVVATLSAAAVAALVALAPPPAEIDFF